MGEVRSDYTVGYSVAWINDKNAQRGKRISIFQLALRCMAGFVLVANFLGFVQVGPFSLLGYFTILFLIVAGMALTFYTRATLKIFKPLFFWGTFLVWLSISFAVSGVTVPQPTIVMAAFVAIMALSGISAWAMPTEAHAVHAILRWAFVANAGLSLVIILTRISADSDVGSRTLAIVALLGLAMTLSYWRRGHPLWFFISIAIWLVPLMTLSRTATICGILLFPLAASLSQDLKRRWTRVLIVAMIAGCGFYAATQIFPRFEGRFFFNRSAQDFINGKATLDTAGRAEMWQSVTESWASTAQTMFIGQGAGSSGEAASKGVSSMNHPHNDYLELLHDYGIVGFSIFVTAFFLLLRGRWKAWSRAEASGSQHAVIHSSAFLMATALAIMMITDNPLEYLFVMLPTALVLGNSVGVEMNERNCSTVPQESTPFDAASRTEQMHRSNLAPQR